MQYTVETITPEMAQKYLTRVRYQRRVSTKTVREYARAMSVGRWMAVNDAICFSTDEELLNGQHRLHAVVLSGVPSPFAVLRNVPAEHFSSMDQGRKRTPDQVGVMGGLANASTVANAAKILCRLKYGLDLDRDRVENSELHEFMEENRDDLLEALRLTGNYRAITPSVACAAYFMFLRVDEALARSFAHGVSTGENLGARDPAMLLRKKCEQIRTRKRSEAARASVMLPQMIAAFNLYQRGEQRTVLTVQVPSYFPDGFDVDKHL